MLNIALLIDVRTAWERDFVSGISRYARLQGNWQVRMPSVRDRNPVGDLDVTGWIRQIEPGAIIITDSVPDLENVLRMGMPTLVNTVIGKKIAGVPNIVGDHAAAAEIAAKHLMSCGFKNFGYCGFDEMHWSRVRCRGFTAAVERAGFPTAVYVQPEAGAGRLWNKEKSVLTEWLTSLPKPVGVMACNDERGRDVIEACAAAGLRVPEDLAVIGVNNDALLCELTTPPLSSVERDFESAGYEAAELLNRMVRSGQRNQTSTILIRATGVAARRSTDILAVDDEEVARALKFIHENAHRLIKVNHVAEAALISRSALYSKFRKVLKSSIAAEIKRSRVEMVAKLLAETNLSIQQIANKLGYSEISNMSRCFLREKGIRPGAYRKHHRP